MRIEKTELEFDEIYKGKVKPIATGGYIPFFKKFIGRIVHIIIPKEEKGFWLFKKEDLIKLKQRVNKMEFPNPYSKQRKSSIILSINNILRHLEGFDMEDLQNIVDSLEGEKDILINKIKKSYSI